MPCCGPSLTAALLPLSAHPAPDQVQKVKCEGSSLTWSQTEPGGGGWGQYCAHAITHVRVTGLCAVKPFMKQVHSSITEARNLYNTFFDVWLELMSLPQPYMAHCTASLHRNSLLLFSRRWNQTLEIKCGRVNHQHEMHEPPFWCGESLGDTVYI